MELVVVGINYKHSPVDVREKFVLQPLEQDLLLNHLKNDPAISEAFVLSTCQRTEVYAYTLHDASERITQHLFTVKNIPVTNELRNRFYIYTEDNAIRHLMNVTTGLDSLILGEKEILGQVKNAVEVARRNRMMNTYLNLLSNICIRTGKQSRSQTQISCGGASTSWAAVAKAEELLGTFQGKSVLIIGTGKIGSLVAHGFHKKGISSLFIMNRNPEKAGLLAQELGSIIVPFWEIKSTLSQVDVCICASGAPHYLIEKELVQEAMKDRSKKKLILVDISVPRNINPDAARIPNVQLLTIDEINSTVDTNLKKRSEATVQVQEMIEKKITTFHQKIEKIRQRGSGLKAASPLYAASLNSVE